MIGWGTYSPRTMTTDCRKLVSEFGKDIRSILRSTLNDGRERGFFVVRQNDELRKGPISVGTNTSVMLRFPHQSDLGSSPEYGEIVGSFHTHPKGRFDNLFSIQDIGSMVNGGIEFSGMAYTTRLANKVSIYKPGGYRTFDSLYNTIHSSAEPVVSKLDLVDRVNQELLYCTKKI